MADTSETRWDRARFHTEALAIKAALDTAHQDGALCCCLCPTCTAYHRLIAEATAALATESSAVKTLAEDAMNKAEDAHQNADKALHYQQTQFAALLADYEALQAGHTALLRDFDTLHAAYVLALEALSRTRSQGGALH